MTSTATDPVPTGRPPHDEVSLAPLSFWARSPEEREEDGAVLRRDRPISWHPPAEGSMEDVPPDILEAGGDGDFVAAVSRRLPQWTIFEMVGLEDQESRDLVTHAADGMVSWADEDVRQGREPAELLTECLLTLINVALDLAERRRAAPADDLMTNLVHAEVDGDRLTDEEIALRLLAGDVEGRIGTAVEEFVRWATRS